MVVFKKDWRQADWVLDLISLFKAWVIVSH